MTVTCLLSARGFNGRYSVCTVCVVAVDLLVVRVLRACRSDVFPGRPIVYDS